MQGRVLRFLALSGRSFSRTPCFPLDGILLSWTLERCEFAWLAGLQREGPERQGPRRGTILTYILEICLLPACLPWSVGLDPPCQLCARGSLLCVIWRMGPALMLVQAPHGEHVGFPKALLLPGAMGRAVLCPGGPSKWHHNALGWPQDPSQASPDR